MEKTLELENEAGFRALFEHATVGIVVVDSRGMIQLANPLLGEMFGYKPTELMGQFLNQLLPKENQGIHSSLHSSFFLNPEPRKMGEGMDLSAMKKDGSVFPVEVALSFYEVGGEPLAVAFVTDITVRKAAESELKRLKAGLEEAVTHRTRELVSSLKREKELNKLKSHFVSVVSHELKAPLTAILSSANLIDRYPKEEEFAQREKHTSRIRSLTRHLTNMLNDLLSLDQLEQEIVKAERVSFEFCTYATEILETLDGTKKNGQTLNYVHNGNSEKVSLDKNMLRSILTNLLTNAIKYSPPGKEIQLQTEVADGQLTIIVKDEGIGIPEDEQGKLFSTYFRASNAHEEQGTGLGMNIVKQYIKILKGQISFSSKLNEGSTFVVRIPI